MPTRQQLLGAATRLHAHLERRHLDRGLVRGPDAGVRFNLRLTRFVKSALGFIPWRDGYVFMQTQGYWILSNWMLYETTGHSRYRDLALEATEATVKLQLPAGGWVYPLPERRHLIATVEGNWGAIGLLATNAREPRAELAADAVRWYEFLVQHIGFQEHPRGKAINYFDQPRGKIPNNSVEAAWFFARLWRATGEARFLDHVPALLDFVAAVQLPSGELPYIVGGPLEPGRVHYLCFQYNAFQFLKLAWLSSALAAASDADALASRAHAIMAPLARFLERGVTASGACAADCSHQRPELDYHTAVLGAALGEAARLNLVASAGAGGRCYDRLLDRQSAAGEFGHSSGDYGFLRDSRSYPRPLAMTLFHLLYPIAGDGFAAGADRQTRPGAPS
ncbi:MAG TPA: hypothetical protein VKU44_04440 [Terriglobia bacterium]|nr:hypothetical protein [Terriglobia bacterium]